MRWLMGLPPGVRLALTALGAAAAVGAVLGLIGDPPWWLVVVAAVIPLALGGAAEIVKHWDAEREGQSEEQRRRKQLDQSRAKAEREFQRRARLALVSWPLRPVQETDPFELGVVRPVPPLQEVSRSGLGPYIQRDQDSAEVPEKLRARGQLLIVGDPGSGATRTAYEAASAIAGEPRLMVAPVAPDGPRALLDLGIADRMPRARVVLWLDRIDTYSADGLTVQHLRQLREKWQGMRVVATITPLAYEQWRLARPDLAAAFDLVRLARVPSAREQLGASEHYEGLDVSQGIGAAFTGLGALLARHTAGDTGCPFEPRGASCEVAQAVVSVAMGWWGTGSLRPLSRAVLDAVIVREMGVGVTAEHVDRALAWATDSTPRGKPLLTSEGTGVEAAIGINTRLAELIADGRPPPLAIWRAALADAASVEDTDAIGRIGLHAHLTLMAQTLRQGLTPASRQQLGASTWADLETAAREAWDGIPAIGCPGIEQMQQAQEIASIWRLPRFQLNPLRRILRLKELRFGAAHLEVSATLNDLGGALVKCESSDEAVPLLERALLIMERDLDADHPDFALALLNLGRALGELRKYGEALRVCEQALVSLERELGPGHLEVARALHGLGAVLLGLGRPKAAVVLYERALAIRERHFGPDDPEVARSVSQLGNCRWQLGRPGEAFPLYALALVILERHLGPNHPDVALVLFNLNLVMKEVGKYGEARGLCERALLIRERHFGPDDPEVAATVGSLGSALQGLGRPRDAIPLYVLALAIFERSNPNHRAVALVALDLGISLYTLDQFETALRFVELAETLFLRGYRPDHGLTQALSHRGFTLVRMGRTREAAGTLARAWFGVRPAFGPSSSLGMRVAQTLRQLGGIPMDDGTVYFPGQDDAPPNHQEEE